MDSRAVGLRRGCLELAVVFSVVLSVRAQEPLPRIRSESSVVLVPTLVRTKAGEITYSLQAKDFVIEDNGVEQDVTLDESPEQEPVSLVVAIQVGHKASSQFKKRADLSLYDSFYSEEERKDCRKRRVPCPTAIAGLGTMLSDFMDQTKGEVALVFGVALYPGHMLENTSREFELNPYVPVTKETPPTFLLQAEDDSVDTVKNSLVYYYALKKAGVPVEMHLYAQGGHAFGLRRTKKPITEWPPLVEKWLKSIGITSE
jgi:Prolyl oligopeptidase family